MSLYDEDKAVEAIKALPKDAGYHLSHIVRNGIGNVLSALKCGCNCKGNECGAEQALHEFEAKWKDLGL